MCRPSDPLCRKPTVPFDSLEKHGPYKPFLATEVTRLLGSKHPHPPANQTRVLFFPKHNSNVTHLPIYEITDAYRTTVKDAPLWSSLYKINIMFMPRPKGDGTDAEVRFFIDMADTGIATIQERTMTATAGATATITPPPKKQGDTVLEVPGLGVFHVRASPDQRSDLDERSRPLSTDFRLYPVLTMESADCPEMQWQVRSQDRGSLCYYLMESIRNGNGDQGEPSVHAVFHHVGGQVHHPVDYSEGVLLLPDAQDPRREVTSIAVVFMLLWHIRDLGAQTDRSSLFKIFGKLGIGKANR